MIKLFATIALFILIITQAFAESPLAIPDTQNSKSTTVTLSADEKIWLSKHPRITITFDAHYPPYSYNNAHGEYVGIAVDIANKLAEKADLELDVYPNGHMSS